MCDGSLDTSLRPGALGVDQIHESHAVSKRVVFSFASESGVDLFEVIKTDGAVGFLEGSVDEVHMEETVSVGVHPAALAFEGISVVTHREPVVEFAPVLADGGVAAMVGSSSLLVDDALGAVVLTLERRVDQLVVVDAHAESRVDVRCLQRMVDLPQLLNTVLHVAGLFKGCVDQVAM